MQRRNFIKLTACLGCTSLIASGCKNFFEEKNQKKDKFIYKTKESLPKEIHLEACSLCQLNCPACKTKLMEAEMPKNWLGYLKFEDFKKFVDDNNFEKIELANNGEIFLNPELNEIIKYGYKKNIILTAQRGVNLNSVNEETLENLIKYKLQYLTVSLDGATGETYKIYRRGGDFDVVIDNIKKINYFKEKYNSEFPKLTWQFIPFGHNEHEIKLAKQKAKKLNMEIFFKCNHFPSYSPVKNKKLVEKQTGIKIFNNENPTPLIRNSFKKQAVHACQTLFYSPQIDYNGDILGCCRTSSFKANAFKDGLLNALNSETIVYAKQMLTDFSIPPKKEIPCCDCVTYKFIKENNYNVLKKNHTT